MPPIPAADRARPLLRDLLAFQLKLFLDALRDVVLSPVSLAAAVVDGLRGRRDRDGLFYRALRLGRRSEDWIDLWAAAREPGEPAPENVDALLARIEFLVRDPRAGARQAVVLRRWLARQRSRNLRTTQAAVPVSGETGMRKATQLTG